jgi:hypothetical protein
VRAEHELDDQGDTTKPVAAVARRAEPDVEGLPSSAERLSERSVLALQRTAGNRAVGRVLAQRPARERKLARLLKIAPTEKLAETSVRDVNRNISETISHAPAEFAAWNNTFSWVAKWRLRLTTKADDPKLEVIVSLYSTASAEQKAKWEKAILDKWDNKFSFCVKKAAATGADKYSEAYPIRVLIAWVNSADKADYSITANAEGANEGGRAGLGGTTSMTGWGTGDTTDITHEFGHILGCPEEYFTTNGVDYATMYGGAGFRIAGAGVMNNPAGPALARNFDIIRQEASSLRGVAADKTEIA